MQCALNNCLPTEITTVEFAISDNKQVKVTHFSMYRFLHMLKTGYAVIFCHQDIIACGKVLQKPVISSWVNLLLSFNPRISGVQVLMTYSNVASLL